MPKTDKTQPFYKGQIPSDWTVATFGELFEFLGTFSFSRENLTDEPTDGGIQYIHYGDIHSKFSGGILDFETNPGVPYLKDGVLDAKALSKKDFPFLKDGDLVIADASEDYEGIGQCVELQGVNGRKVIAGLHTFAIRPKNGRILPGFRTHLLRHPERHPEIERELRRVVTGISVLGISKSNIARIKLPVPPLEEQRKILEILNQLESIEALLASRLDEAKRQKTGYIQALISGKWRIR